MLRRIMSMGATHPQGFDFSVWLARYAEPGAVIASAAVDFPDGLTQAGDVQHTDTAVWVPVTAPTVGDYQLEFTINLDVGPPYVEVRTMLLMVRHR